MSICPNGKKTRKGVPAIEPKLSGFLKYVSPLADPGELQEILYELAKNALQAMQKGKARVKGKLILQAQLGFSTHEEPFALVTVADTGPGIPEEELPNLFQPFFTTQPGEGGNGLGLYLAKQLVLNNEGKITAASFEGFGTSFAIELPVA